MRDRSNLGDINSGAQRVLNGSNNTDKLEGIEAEAEAEVEVDQSVTYVYC